MSCEHCKALERRVQALENRWSWLAGPNLDDGVLRELRSAIKETERRLLLLVGPAAGAATYLANHLF